MKSKFARMVLIGLSVGVLGTGTVYGQGTDGVMLESAKTVSSAKLSKKNLRARKAYKKLLEGDNFIPYSNNGSKVTDPRFALIDINSDGVDELFFDNHSYVTAGNMRTLYSYNNGKVTVVHSAMASCSLNPIKVYRDGYFSSECGAHGGHEILYWKLKKNGKVNKILNMSGTTINPAGSPYSAGKKYIHENNTGYVDGTWWVIHKINGKQSTIKQCRSWIKKFKSTHKQINPYIPNTKKNRSKMLKVRKLK